MAMTRKKQRTVMILAGLGILAVAVGLIMTALNDTIVFFYTPSEVAEKHISPETRFRLGGLVEKGSWKHGEGAVNNFVITDNDEVLKVAYTGPLPDLFKEGQGVVAEGKLNRAGVFIADTVLAKHDENYMPKEVADALKKKGYWQHDKDEETK